MWKNKLKTWLEKLKDGTIFFFKKIGFNPDLYTKNQLFWIFIFWLILGTIPFLVCFIWAPKLYNWAVKKVKEKRG